MHAVQNGKKLLKAIPPWNPPACGQLWAANELKIKEINTHFSVGFVPQKRCIIHPVQNFLLLPIIWLEE